MTHAQHRKFVRTVPAEMRDMVREALRNAQRVRLTGDNHLRLVGPSGVALVPGSPSADRRTRLNIRADLRRAGLLAA